MNRRQQTFTAILVVTVAGTLTCAPAVRATNGYFSDGYGTISKGLAGAGVAFSQDALVAALNPAGLAFIDSRVDVGVDLFNPVRGYSVTGLPSGQPGTFPLADGSVESKRNYFLVPDVGASWTQGNNAAIGFALYGNGGMNTTYPANAGGDGTYHGGQAGVNLDQLFFTPTYAHKIGPKAALGVSAILAYQDFEARGLGAFAPFVADGNANNLSGRGLDKAFGYGARLGLIGEIRRNLNAGVAYQTRISMGRFAKYSDLFAQGGSFDIPASVTGGLAWTVDRRSTVLFDVQNIFYSDVPAVGNPFSNLLNGIAGKNSSQLLGGQNGPGFGWNDMTAFKLGYQFQANSTLALRVGASYGQQPIPSSGVLFNILAPGVEQVHLSAGLTKKVSSKGEVNLAVTYAPGQTVIGPNPMDPTQTISL